MNQTNDSEDPVIFRYTRAQAIEDGVLVDLTEWAAETGFKIPVACTQALWHEWIVPPEGTRELGQSERGRAHDVLWLAWVAIRKSAPGKSQIEYQVRFLDAKCRHRTATLKAICGPGDAGEPVLTLLLPHED